MKKSCERKTGRRKESRGNRNTVENKGCEGWLQWNQEYTVRSCGVPERTTGKGCKENPGTIEGSEPPRNK